jgi:hypothetical protein
MYPRAISVILYRVLIKIKELMKTQIIIDTTVEGEIERISFIEKYNSGIVRGFVEAEEGLLHFLITNLEKHPGVVRLLNSATNNILNDE